MKTPMEELIEIIKKRQEDDEAMPFMYNDKIIALAESMLEKEKEQIIDAWMDDRFPLDKDWTKQCAKNYYEQTYGDKK